MNTEINNSKSKISKQKAQVLSELKPDIKTLKVKSIILESIKHKIKNQLTT